MSAVQFDSLARFMPTDTHLDQSEKDEIASMFESHVLNKNNYFLTQGDHVHQVSCLTQGILCRWEIDKNGKLQVDQIIRNDYFFTECKCYQHNGPACYNITALTPCEFMTISTTNLKALKNANPKFDQLHHQITFNVMQKRKDQDDLFLHDSMIERILHFYGYFGSLSTCIKIKYIVSLLHISLSQFYATRKKYLENNPVPEYF